MAGRQSERDFDMNITGRFILFLLPTVGRGALSFLLLPITTFYLDPADFGFYALVTSITGISAAIACSGSAYALASNFQTASLEEKKSLVSTVLAASLVIGLLLSILFLIGWELFGVSSIEGIALSPALIWLGIALMILPIPWTYGVQVSTLDGQTKAYAIIQFGEAVVSGVVTILMLFFSREKQLALFVGGTAGAAFTVLGTLWILKPYLRGRLNAKWLSEIAGVGIASLLSTMAEKIQTVVERAVVSKYVGIDQLGIYSHSQQYRTLVSAGAKSVSYSVWPISLDEARDEAGTFPRTTKAWELTALFVTIAGVLFSTLGEHVIGVLTHGKFSSAYILAALWMAYILIQNTGRVQLAYLYVRRLGTVNQHAITFSIALSVALLFFLAPEFGLNGILLAVFAQAIIYRFLLTKITHAKHSSRGDISNCMGVIVILISLYFSWWEPGTLARSVNIALSIAAIIFVFRDSVRTISNSLSKSVSRQT